MIIEAVVSESVVQYLKVATAKEEGTDSNAWW